MNDERAGSIPQGRAALARALAHSERNPPPGLRIEPVLKPLDAVRRLAVSNPTPAAYSLQSPNGAC